MLFAACRRQAVRPSEVTIIINAGITAKKNRLTAIVKKQAPLAVALSGGVDSALLLAVAHEAVGDAVVALTSISPLHPAKERQAAARVAATLGVRQVEWPTRRLETEEFTVNSPDRCYICKKILWAELGRAAAGLGVERLADGLCVDELDDDRPGIRAGREKGVLSPLVAVGLRKEEVVQLARAAGLPVWDQPSNACLATRIPSGTPITVERLARIEAAESLLHDYGFARCRVRLCGQTARIEVDPEQIDQLTEKSRRERIRRELQKLGFVRVAADLGGYGADNNIA